MAYFPPEVWVALLAAGGAGILAILHVLAKRLRREVQLHDLRIRTVELRNAYAKRLEALNGQEMGEVEEVDDHAPAEPVGRIDAAPHAASQATSESNRAAA